MSDETTTTPVATRRSARTEVQTISVTLRPLFGTEETLSVPADTTVGDLLTNRGMNPSSEVRLIEGSGSQILNTDSILEDGDVIQILSGKKITNA